MRFVEQFILNGAIILAAGGALAGGLPDSGGQTELDVGSTVRVSYSDSGLPTGTPDHESQESEKPGELTAVGELVEVSGDFITVRPSDGARPVVIPKQCIIKVELKKGGTPRLVRALLIGGISFGLGALVSESDSPDEPRNSFGPSGQEVAGATIAAVGVLGALVSLFFESSKWEEVQRNDNSVHNIRLGFSNGARGQTGVFLSGCF